MASASVVSTRKGLRTPLLTLLLLLGCLLGAMAVTAHAAAAKANTNRKLLQSSIAGIAVAPGTLCPYLQGYTLTTGVDVDADKAAGCTDISTAVVLCTMAPDCDGFLAGLLPDGTEYACVLTNATPDVTLAGSGVPSCLYQKL